MEADSQLSALRAAAAEDEMRVVEGQISDKDGELEDGKWLLGRF